MNRPRHVGIVGLAMLYAFVIPFVAGTKLAEHRRTNYGLIGYGIQMYEPLCAFSCREILASCPLACSKREDTHEMLRKKKRHGTSGNFETSLDCYAQDHDFLLSLALCLQQRCNDTDSWKIERFWERDAVGDQSPQPTPVYTYYAAQDLLQPLNNATLPYVERGHHFETVSQVSLQDWNLAFRTYQADTYVEQQHSRSAAILILCTAVTPVLLGMVRSFSILKSWKGSLISDFGYAALWRGRHSVPLPHGIGILPTRGQLLFIAYMILLNLLLCSTGYRLEEPNFSNSASLHRLASYVANRTGILSFANLTLMFLFCGRNNAIVILSGWSYRTMLLYHRWAAYISVVQALIHSIIYIIQHKDVLDVKFTQAYWNWGTAAAIIMIIIIPLSVLRIRRRAYEFFLDTHMFLSTATIVACYYHIFTKFRHEWGYENWLFLAAVIWVLDRLLRATKLIGNGLKIAYLTRIDSEYMRVDIPGVRAAGHAFLYFPTLSWRFWQNHPFSIASSLLQNGTPEGSEETQMFIGDAINDELASLRSDESFEDKMVHTNLGLHDEAEDTTPMVSSTVNSPPPTTTDTNVLLDGQHVVVDSSEIHKGASVTSIGVTFYIRREQGVTSELFKSKKSTLPVLIEGPYLALPIPDLAARPKLVAIAGGVGISTVLPIVLAHALHGETALYWSSRSQALVDDVNLSVLHRAGVRVYVKVRQRWDLPAVVRSEVDDTDIHSEVTVVVSGPNEMADDVRAAVVKANKVEAKRGRRARATVRLVEESFSW